MNIILSKLDGPPLGGQGNKGQYVYWICMAHLLLYACVAGAWYPVWQALYSRDAGVVIRVRGVVICGAIVVFCVASVGCVAHGHYSDAYGRLKPQTVIILCFSSRNASGVVP